MYSAGQLNEVIEIIRVDTQDDGYGGEVQNDFLLSTEFAHVKPRSGGEAQEHDRLMSSATYIFVIWNRADIKENFVINWNGSRFQVRNPKYKGAGELFLEIEAEKNVN